MIAEMNTIPSDARWLANIALSQDASPGLAEPWTMSRTNLNGGWYHGFNKDFIFSFTGSAGYIDGWNGDSIRISDLFYKGGDTFRGFQIAGIGPRDLQFDDALGGKLFAIGTMEMTIPTKLPEQYGIKAALFTDFGTLGLLDKSATINPGHKTTNPDRGRRLGPAMDRGYGHLLEIAHGSAAF